MHIIVYYIYIYYKDAQTEIKYRRVLSKEFKSICALSTESHGVLIFRNLSLSIMRSEGLAHKGVGGVVRSCMKVRYAPFFTYSEFASPQMKISTHKMGLKGKHGMGIVRIDILRGAEYQEQMKYIFPFHSIIYYDNIYVSISSYIFL